MTDVVGVIVVDIVLTAEGHPDRKGVGRGPALQCRLGRLRPAAAADQQKGPLRLAQKALQSLQVGRIGTGRTGGESRKVGDARPFDQHVLGQCQRDRAGPARGRHREGPADELGDPGRIVDLRRPLCQRPEKMRVVDLLEALAAAQTARHLPDEEDHRRRVLKGDVQSRTGVCGAGPSGDEGDAGLAGQLAFGLGHHRRAALVPGDHELQVAAVDQGVEHRQVTLPRHAVSPPGTVDQ